MKILAGQSPLPNSATVSGLPVKQGAGWKDIPNFREQVVALDENVGHDESRSLVSLNIKIEYQNPPLGIEHEGAAAPDLGTEILQADTTAQQPVTLQNHEELPVHLVAELSPALPAESKLGQAVHLDSDGISLEESNQEPWQTEGIPVESASLPEVAVGPSASPFADLQQRLGYPDLRKSGNGLEGVRPPETSSSNNNRQDLLQMPPKENPSGLQPTNIGNLHRATADDKLAAMQQVLQHSNAKSGNQLFHPQQNVRTGETPNLRSTIPTANLDLNLAEPAMVRIKPGYQQQTGQVPMLQPTPVSGFGNTIVTLSRSLAEDELLTNTRIADAKTVERPAKIFEVQLVPRNLGVVEVKIANQGGVLSIEIQSQKPQAEQVLRQEIASIKETILRAGLAFDEISISTNSQIDSGSSNQRHDRAEGQTAFTRSDSSTGDSNQTGDDESHGSDPSIAPANAGTDSEQHFEDRAGRNGLYL